MPLQEASTVAECFCEQWLAPTQAANPLQEAAPAVQACLGLTPALKSRVYARSLSVGGLTNFGPARGRPRKSC